MSITTPTKNYRQLSKWLSLALIVCALPGSAVRAQHLSIEGFDAPVPTAATAANNVWYPDRFAPAVFESSTFNGRSVLHHQISSAQAAAARPSGRRTTFYNTHGRSYNLSSAVNVLTADLYIPASWDTLRRRADIWSKGYSASSATSPVIYPIIGFANTEGNNPVLRYYLPDGTWANITSTINYDSWYSFRMEIKDTLVRYFVNNSLVGQHAANNATYFGGLIAQGYNFADSTLPAAQQDFVHTDYDIYWDNIGGITNIHNVTANTWHTTIQQAIDNSNTGNVIEVAAGNYSGNVTVNKSVTLNGPNAVIDGNGVRAEEAVVLNSTWTLGGVNSTVSGFKFYNNVVADNQRAVTISATGNIVFSYNVVSREAAGSTGSWNILRGVEMSNKTAGTTDISHNLFTGDGSNIYQNSGWRTGIWSNGGSGITYTANVFENTRSAINLDDFGAGQTLTGNTFSGSNGSQLSFGGTVATTGQYTISGNEFGITDPTRVTFNLSNVASTFAINATGNTFNGINTPSLTDSQKFLVEMTMYHRGRSNRNGVVNYLNGQQVVVPVNPSIQKAIDAALAGNTVLIAPGTYNADFIANKAGLVIKGMDAATTIIQGLNSGSAHTIQISSPNVVLKKLTVTRDFGADTTSWYASIKNQGITVNQNVSGTVLDSLIVTGNRNGIYGQITPNTTITNSLIENNRTGIHFGRNVSGSVVENNIIRNNFTHGILYNADFGAAVNISNVQVRNNAIYGNWYSGINYQNNTNQTIAPSDIAGYDASCNWYGSGAQPTVVVAATSEPGYAAQLPSQFGGVNPGGAYDIAGLGATVVSPLTFATSGTESGTSYTPAACNNAVFPVMNISRNKGYLNIQPAISDATTMSGDTIVVSAGTYAENISVTKPLTILGPNAGVNPNTGTRGAEAIIVPATAGGIATLTMVDVKASDVTIDGFTVDGDNTAITSGFLGTNGADIDAAEGLSVNTNNINRLKVLNNIVKNISYQGVSLFGATTAAPRTTGHIVKGNLIKNLGTYDAASGIANWGGGVLVYNSQYTRVENNVIDSARIGIQTGNFHTANTGGTDFQVITGNTIRVRRRGIFHNLQTTNASPYTISNNTITAIAAPGPETLWGAVLLGSLTTNTTLENNSIDGSGVSIPTEGYNVWNVGAATPSKISGGSVTGVATGVFVNNYDGYNTNAGYGANAVISNMNINADSVGIRVFDNPLSTHVRASLRIDTNVVVNGAQYGLVVENDSARITALSNISFQNVGQYYIRLINNKNDLNATSAMFDIPAANTVASTLNYANAMAVEAKILDKDDNAALGQVVIKTPVVNISKERTQSPALFRYITIQSAINAASVGDTLTAAAWEYNEDVNINKAGIKLIGADPQTTIIRGLYTTSGNSNTVGITQNNVLVEGFTITRDYGTTLPDWYGTTKGQGIGLGNNVSGTTINRVILRGNRNGFYGQNAPNTTITNSLIEDNRTGIHFGRDVSGSVVKNNIIRNNFTHGILYNADFGAEVVVTNVQVDENAIYGNWYSAINYQNNSNQTLNPSSFNGYSAACNWYGSTAQPTVVAANPGEPGYATQVPSQFGGTNPGGASDITGLGATLIAPASYAAAGTETGTSFSVDSCKQIIGVTQLTACGNFNLLVTDSLQANALSGATAYTFAVSTISGSLIDTFNTTGNKLAIALIPGIDPGDSIKVKVKGLVSGTWSEYGPECAVGLASLLTQLDTANCGKMDLTRNGSITAVPVAGATSYQFRIATPSNTVIKTITNATNIISLTDTVFKPGYNYNVSVRAMAGGVYGAYGTVCAIGFTDPTTAIAAPFCGEANIYGEDTVTATPVAGADTYEFRISSLSGALIATVVSNDNMLALSPAVFVPGEPRRVTVRVAFSGVYGSYGDTCTVGLAKTVTALSTASCGRQNYLITDTMYVAALPIADDYQLDFYNAANNAFVTTIASAPNARVIVGNVSGLLKGSSYKVVVRINVDGIWLSQYGDTCVIRLGDPKTKLLICGGSINSLSTITADSARDVAGAYRATRYKFSFRQYASPYTNYDNVAYESTTASLPGTAFSSLFNGTNYYVKVSAQVAGQWTPVRDSCLLTFARGSRNKNNGGGDTTLNVNETNLENEIILAPNPAIDVVHVSGQFNGDVSLVVLALDGRVLIRQQAVGNNNEKLSVNVSSLPAGYYLMAIYNKGQVVYKRFSHN